jgi:hypothetical protein
VAPELEGVSPPGAMVASSWGSYFFDKRETWLKGDGVLFYELFI